MTLIGLRSDGPEDAEFVAASTRRGPRRRPEREIVNETLTFLRGFPQGYARKVHGGAMGNVGEPDVDACVGGRACKFEAKGDGNKPTGPQLAALRRWAKAGALVGWFRTLDHVRQLLEHRHEIDFIPDLSSPGCSCSSPVHGASS